MTDKSKFPEQKVALTAASFRFSLLTLLSITTLAGFTSAIAFSNGFDPFERVLMAFWCAGLILGMSVGRARGKPGIMSAGLAAALGCALATGYLHLGDYHADDRVVILTFVVVAGWLIAVGGAAVYHALLTGLVERWWQRRFFRRTVYAITAICATALIGWQALSDRPWRAAWELQVPLDARDGGVELALAPQGDRLLTFVDARHGHVDLNRAGQIHELTPRGLASRSFPLGWGHEAVVFSPDGLQIAARHGGLYTVFEADGGHIAYSQHMDTRWIEQQPLPPPRFSADGRRLLVTTHTPRIQRLYTYDLTNPTTASPHIELFPFAGQLLISADGQRLIKFFDAEDETDERRVEILELSDWKTIARIGDVPRVLAPVFSLDGKRFALGDRIWTLPDGKPRPVGGEAIGLLTEGRALVREEAVNRRPAWLPDWLQQMPFVKHFYPRETRSRLKVVHETTGETLRATLWLEQLDRVELSANQRVVAATSSTGQIRIWKVPE